MRPDPVAIARAWIGTPYVHQASRQGAGADCLGLIRGVFRVCHGTEPAVIPPYSSDWSEPQGEERLWQAALTHLHPKPLHDPQPGDVILFRMRAGAVAKHLGLQSGPAAFIHAYAGQGVTESPLTPPWARRIVARFSLFPTE